MFANYMFENPCWGFGSNYFNQNLTNWNSYSNWPSCNFMNYQLAFNNMNNTVPHEAKGSEPPEKYNYTPDFSASNHILRPKKETFGTREYFKVCGTFLAAVLAVFGGVKLAPFVKKGVLKFAGLFKNIGTKILGLF